MTFLKASILSLVLIATALPVLGASRQDRLQTNKITEQGASDAVKGDTPNEIASKYDLKKVKEESGN